MAEGDRCRCGGCFSRRYRTATREQGAAHRATGRRPVPSRGKQRRRATEVSDVVKEGEGMSDITSVRQITPCQPSSHDIIPSTTRSQTMPSDVMFYMAESNFISRGCHGSSCGVAADHRAAQPFTSPSQNAETIFNSSPVSHSVFSDTFNHDNIIVLDA